MPTVWVAPRFEFSQGPFMRDLHTVGGLRAGWQILPVNLLMLQIAYVYMHEFIYIYIYIIFTTIICGQSSRCVPTAEEGRRCCRLSRRLSMWNWPNSSAVLQVWQCRNNKH